MPFNKITSGKDAGKYKSPSGRVMTKGQVTAYHASKSSNKTSPKSGKKK